MRLAAVSTDTYSGGRETGLEPGQKPAGFAGPINVVSFYGCTQVKRRRGVRPAEAHTATSYSRLHSSRHTGASTKLLNRCTSARIITHAHVHAHAAFSASWQLTGGVLWQSRRRHLSVLKQILQSPSIQYLSWLPRRIPVCSHARPPPPRHLFFTFFAPKAG